MNKEQIVKTEPIGRHLASTLIGNSAITADTKRILVVDDEPLLVIVNKKRLAGSGYQVTGVFDSREALDQFRNQPDAFDLLIADQSMPGLSGADLAKAVLAIKPSMLIILCADHGDTISEENALSMGIKKYVYKPLFGDELIDTVREVLGQV